MNINNNDLKVLFQENIKNSTAISRADCPSATEILQFFRSKQLEHKKSKIIDHITLCYHCTQEFEFVLETLRFEKKMNQFAEKLAVSQKTKSKKRFFQTQSFIRRFSWRYVFVTSILIILLSTITYFFIPMEFKSYQSRSVKQNQIKIISSFNNISPGASVSFQWESIENSEYYIIEIFDETMYPIWTSEKTYSNYASPPVRLLSSLRQGKTYFWMVTAFYSNGTKMESLLQKFFVKKSLKNF